MDQHHRIIISSSIIMLGASFACMSSAFAAKPIDLKHQSIQVLQSISSPSLTNQTNLKQMSSSVDFNQTTHIRVKETYAGFPVWGGDAVIHVPRGENASLQALIGKANSKIRMNGIVYQDLNKDLETTPVYIFSATQSKQALEQSIALYQKKTGSKYAVSEAKTNLIVFIDKNHKAHWAFLVSFLVSPEKSIPVKPTYILDAKTFEVYQEWDDIKTLDEVEGGGFGGNEKMGRLIYDGLQGDLPKLNMMRDADTKMCYLKNNDVIVNDVRDGYNVYKFQCEAPDEQYGKVYWHGNIDAVNGAYSPADDALFTGAVVKDMYMKWYDVPVLVENGKPMILTMNVHKDMENAYWYANSMTFGDGGSMFYPLVSLGVAAHEISHGFTEQHSNLIYWGQSGGLNEAYSDMAAQAGEFYAYGHNSWQIGPEIFKAKDRALRYMDEPTKDCKPDQEPGNRCSISNVKDYHDGINVHYTSGIFNKAFYLLGTSKDWDTKKAFDVMVKANEHYWTPNTSFADAACGVLYAAKDYQYDTTAVVAAMAGVGIDTSSC